MAEKLTAEDILREIDNARLKSKELESKSSMNPVIEEEMKVYGGTKKKVVETDFSATRVAGQTRTFTVKQEDAPVKIPETKNAEVKKQSDTFEFEQVRSGNVDNFLKNFNIPEGEKQVEDLSEQMHIPDVWGDDMVVVQEEEEVLFEDVPKKKLFSFALKTKGREKKEKSVEENLEDEYTNLADRDKISLNLEKQMRSAVIRLGITMASFILLFYLAVANFIAIPLPPFIYPETTMITFIGVNLGVLLLSILASAFNIGNGIVNLLTLKGDGDSATALGVLATFGHGIVLMLEPEYLSFEQGHFYFVVAALLLLASAIGDYLQIKRTLQNFDIVQTTTGKRSVYAVEDEEQREAIIAPQVIQHPHVLYSTNTSFIKGFIHTSFTHCETLNRFVVPATLVLGIIVAVVSYINFAASVVDAYTYFTAIMVVSASLCSSLNYNLPLYRVAKQFTPLGGCIIGEETINETAKALDILVTGGDLYYGKNAPVYGIKPFVGESLNQAIIDMASIATTLNMPMKQGVLGIINNNLSLLNDLESYHIVPERGVVSYIEGRKVLVGSRAMMQMFHIAVPDEAYEGKLKGDRKELLYIAEDDTLVAVFVVGYAPPPALTKPLLRLEKQDVGISISSADPNITVKRVSEDFGYDPEFVNLVDASASAYCEMLYKNHQLKGVGAVIPNHPTMFLRYINSCISIKRRISIAQILQVIGTVLGFIAVTFLAFTGSINNLSFINLVLFQLLFAFASLVVLLGVKFRGD